MYGSIKDISSYTLRAHDGDIGHICDACFDDAGWVLQHLVAEFGSAPDTRVARIPMQAVQHIDPAERAIVVSLTRQQVREASQSRATLEPPPAAGYIGPVVWGPDMFPTAGEALIVPPADAAFPEPPAPPQPQPPLCSGREVVGYQVAASDGAIGHIADLLFDELTAQVRFVVVDTHNWLPDRLVLVVPAWISHMDHAERQVRVRVTRSAVKSSPRYTPGSSVSKADEELVQSHYTAWLAAAARARERFVEIE